MRKKKLSQIKPNIQSVQQIRHLKSRYKKKKKKKTTTNIKRKNVKLNSNYNKYVGDTQHTKKI